MSASADVVLQRAVELSAKYGLNWKLSTDRQLAITLVMGEEEPKTSPSFTS